MEFGFEPISDQLQTSFEPASVMEFGFDRASAEHSCAAEHSTAAFLSVRHMTEPIVAQSTLHGSHGI